MTWQLVVGGAAIGLGLLVLLALVLPPTGPRAMSPEERVTSYVGPGADIAAAAAARRPGAVAQATGAAAQVLGSNRGLERRIRRRLEAAGSRLTAAEWLVVHAAVLVVTGLAGLLLGVGSVPVFLAVTALGAVGPWVYLRVRAARRRRAFAAAVPDTLQLMAGSLAAGLSLAQAVDSITREGADPVAAEFRRALVEHRLGVPLEDALDGVAERFGSDDLHWAVLAIRIQRGVGGNLAELLDTVAATMREREYVRRQVSALSAEGRLSAWVLGCLPVAFALYLAVTDPGYLDPLLHDPRGIFLSVAGAVWLAVGALWMSRMVRVEV